MFEAIEDVEAYFVRHLSNSTYGGTGPLVSDLLWEYALLKHTSEDLQTLLNDWFCVYPALAEKYMLGGDIAKSPLRISGALCTAVARLPAASKQTLYSLISSATPTYNDTIGRLVIGRPELSTGDILRAAGTYEARSAKRAGLLTTLLQVRQAELTEEALYAVAELSAPGMMVHHVCDHPLVTGDIMVYYYQKAKQQGVDDALLAYLEQRLMRTIG